jgi:hypothetical protein
VGGRGAVRLGVAVWGLPWTDSEELAGLLAEARKGNKPALEALLKGLRGWVR